MKKEIEKKEEIAPQELSQEVVMKHKKSRKKFLIFLGISLIILISLFCYLFMDKIIDIFDHYAVVENKEETEEEISDVDAKATIRVYKMQNDDINVYVYEDKEFAELLQEDEDYYSKYIEIAKYNCANAGCEGMKLYNPNYSDLKEVFIKDGECYLYNYNTKSKQELLLSETDNLIYPEAAIYNGKLYGLLFDGLKRTFYYSLSNDKEYDFEKEYTDFNKNYIVKNDGYYLFDFIKNSYTKLPFEEDLYSRIEVISYNDVLYGYKLVKEDDSSNSGYTYSFYSLKSNKIIIADTENEFFGGPELLKNHIIANNKLYDLTTGEELHDFVTNFIPIESEDSIADCYYVNAIGNKNSTYYLVNTDCLDGATGYLLDENYNILFNGKDDFDWNMGVNKDGNLIINNVNEDDESTSFSLYDKTGKLISTSKTYKKVLGIFGLDEDYIAVVDTDDYLKLVTSDGKVITKFTKWTDEMHFHPMISGFNKYNNFNAIYLVVADSSIGTSVSPDLELGYGYEYYYNIETKASGKIATEIGGYGKPVLYLYPTKKTNITVTFENPKSLTTTYPKYKNNWQVTAYPNGDLYDNNNNYYYALYWEEMKNHEIDFKEGFYVTKDSAIEFLESKLTTIGLNPKERNEFIMYWLPILEKNGKNLVYFELTEERDFYNKLIINPTPDSLLRVAIHVKKVSKKVDIKEQELKTFKRTGFAAVEWGGVEH